MPETPSKTGGRRIIWLNVLTVASAAILISAEVFGAAFAGGWAVANLFEFGSDGVHIFQAIFFVLGIAVMIAFVRNAKEVEPFLTKR
ncbi:MAG TPA: hypothetical protein VIY51_03855 [Xanthobacteraceae bacterium]